MEVRKLGIIGAGQMGCGIAQVAAQAGIEVVLVDAQPMIADKGKKKIDAKWIVFLANSRFKDQQRRWRGVDE